MKNLFTNVIKTNKGGIIKGALIAGGVVVVGLVAKAILNTDKDEIEIPAYEVKDSEENEEETSDSEPTGI